MFGSTSFMSSQNGNGAAQGSSSAQQQPTTSLSSLLAQANSLNTIGQDGSGDSELPQLRFGLNDIEQMSEGVLGGRSRRGKSTKGEGHALLSNLGINTAQLSHDISQLPDADTSARPKRKRRTAPVSLKLGNDSAFGTGDQDVSSWGRNWHETIILSGIEYQRQKTVKNFQDQFQARMLANWEAEKAKVLQDELGVTDDEVSKLSNGGGMNGLGSSSLGKSSLGASTRRFPMASSSLKSSEAKDGGLVMHTKMIRYERVISEMNRRRLRKEPFEICQALMDSASGDSKSTSLLTAYRILAFLTYEPSLSNSEHAEQVQERQYANAYLGDQASNRAAMLRGRLAAGGKRYLEQDFEKHIDETIAKHPKEAALGGIPGIANKIRAYVDVLSKTNSLEGYKPETVDGTYLWTQCYYLFRCGYLQESLDLLTSRQTSLRRDDYTFPGALQSYISSPQHRLPKSQKDQLYNDFNSHIRNNPTVDQFKYALYKIVGRFELSRKNVKVASTTEDWIWLQLSLVRESKDDGPQQAYTLDDMGSMVGKYGNEKFDANGSKPFAWFNLLLFAGQFERAIAYLYSKPALRTDAVHLAIALQYYGLLRVGLPDTEILSETDEGISYLNFTRIIKTYISPFARVEPQTALQYAYLVAMGSDAQEGVGEKQKGAALELVRDIVLVSRSWGKLLGSVRADGTQEIGMIERDLSLLGLSDSSDYLRHIVLSAADQSALDASLTDSIELYHLAGAYDKVIESVNRALGASLSLPTSTQDISPALGLSGAFGGVQDLYTLGQRVHGVYERDVAARGKVSEEAWKTLSVLLALKLALKQFAENRPDLCFETIKSTGILPLFPNDQSANSRSASNFISLMDQPSISSLDEILLITMKCLHQLSQQLQTSVYDDRGRNEQIVAYKQMAMNVVQFVGELRLRVGPDTYRQLTSMGAFF